MTRLMRLAAVVFAIAAAALLIVHVVPADAASATGSPVSSMFSRLDPPAPGASPSPSAGGNSSVAAPGNTSAAGEQEAAEPQGQDAQDHELSGSVKSIDSARQAFVLASAAGTTTVIATPQTEFEDGISSLGDLRPGMAVTVEGASQADGSVIAAQTKGPTDSSEYGGSGESPPSNSGD